MLRYGEIAVGISTRPEYKYGSGTWQGNDVEKAVPMHMEAVHTTEQYALTYARWHRRSCKGPRDAQSER
jgi:hypothetical protein